MDDSIYADILNFYTRTGKKYPRNIYELPPDKRVDAKSRFRQSVKPFHVENGAVFRGYKEVLVKSRVSTILQECHDNQTTGGHLGRDKTLAKISVKYYWKGMKSDVQEYIRKCLKCSLANQKIHNEAPLLSPIPVPAKIWSLVEIDIIGPLHETVRGNRYIVVATDHFSKWSEAAAISDNSANFVAQFLYFTICRLGCMDTLTSDQGRDFVSQVLDFLFGSFQRDHRITSADHPQSDGQHERDNRTLKEVLRKLVSDQADDWDLYIPGLLFAYHTSVHPSTKCTPFEVMYGRPCKLPHDVKFKEEPVNLDSESDNSTVLESLERKEINSAASANIIASQKHQEGSRC